MTARFFMQEVPGLTQDEAFLLKEVLLVQEKYCNTSNVYYDKIKQIAFNLRKCGGDNKRPRIMNKTIATTLVKYTDQDWLQLQPEKEAPTTSSRALLRSLLSVDTLDDEGLAANAPLIICRDCGGSEVAFDSQQTRSIDEGATIFVFCLNPVCLKQWTISS